MQQTKWQKHLQTSNKIPAGLIPPQQPDRNRQYSQAADEHFPFRAPAAYLQKINHDDPEDPLLRQILPVTAEEDHYPGFSVDPLQEDGQQPVPGVLHKYYGRALLVATAACAIHCRYCFRRHFPYADNRPSADNWQKAIDYLNNDPAITEIILSGGDPLTLSDHRLSELLSLLAGVSHLKRLRIHSRIPVVLPERINNDLLGLLANYSLPVVMVVHVNHADELDDAAACATRRLRDSGVILLNQSVLLRGVNDSVRTLETLSEKLFKLGILPYYLHMPDPVAGTAHFAVSEMAAGEIMRELNARLPGYLVPRLVREITGEDSKVPVNF